MIFNEIKNDIKLSHTFPLLIISLFPITAFIGSGVINVQIILLDLFFLFELFKHKKFEYLRNKYFYLLLFIWFIFLTNLFFSIDFNNSFLRSFGFLRFLILIFAIKYFVFDADKNYQKYIFSVWIFSFLIISLDLIYEFFVGKNIFGFVSYMPGRLSGFFNDELKIGYLYSFFSLIVLSSLYLSMKRLKINISIFYIVFLSVLIISFLIGERANFIKTFFMFFVFFFVFENKLYKSKIFIFAIISLISVFLLKSLNNDNDYKYRFWGMFLKPIIHNPVDFFYNSNYGDHYRSAYEVFKDHKLFGVGIKNYRVAVESDKYGKNTSIHPHEKHLELLSEIGLFGYLTLITILMYCIIKAVKIYALNKNLYQLSGLLFLIANLIPLIPSGSFYTTYTATFFWMSFAFMINEKR
tara:strand:+ start:269 stop:1498 length:1230 start_codon:yes stop_codon:yes gene_type:complete